jgi:hypothetical protein
LSARRRTKVKTNFQERMEVLMGLGILLYLVLTGVVIIVQLGKLFQWLLDL